MKLALEAQPARAEIERVAGMVSDGSLFRHPSAMLAMGTIWVLVVGGRPDLARQVGDAVVAMGEHQGSILLTSVGRFWRSTAEYDLGLIADAAADSAAAFEIALRGAGDEEGLSYILSALIDAHVEAGEYELADEALARASSSAEAGSDDAGAAGASLPQELPERAGFAFLVESRGRLRAAQDRHEEAAEDLLDAGRRWRKLRVTSPVPTVWRGDAALALRSLGRHEESLELASAQLELAREAEEPRTLGAALRALGELKGGASGSVLLREAVEVLEESPARLELARALLALGRARRRAGERAAAREPLSRALDIAHRGGAGRIAGLAREELRLAGARPRRRALTGPESLTPAERRVAELAAEGAANKDIAQRLFVSLRTVETHLTHAYQKLEIASRDQLSGALEQR